MPWGEILFVGHDALFLGGLRAIIVNALGVSGALILVLGLAAAAALSLAPLRRIEALREASRVALEGQLGVRLPITRRRDEMDMLAGVANAMMDETERLLFEVKSVGDNVAHDLRTRSIVCGPCSTGSRRRPSSRAPSARWSNRRWPRPTSS